MLRLKGHISSKVPKIGHLIPIGVPLLSYFDK